MSAGMPLDDTKKEKIATPVGINTRPEKKGYPKGTTKEIT
jgi:hypothetical protein